jgi:hypothetical protein
MSDKVILGIPFISMLYPFKVELGEVSTIKIDVQVRFQFASRFEIDISQLSQSLVHGRTFCCLDIPSNNILSNASKIGFRGIPKQLVSTGSSEQIVKFHSRSWNFAHYNIIKKFFALFKILHFKQIFEYFWF